jgi:hypothetical protein
MPETRIIFFQDDRGEVPVLKWLNKLLKQDRKGYANCIARIEQLAEYGFELRRPAADFLRDGIYELSSTLSKIKKSVFFIRQKPWLFGKYFFHVTDYR